MPSRNYVFQHRSNHGWLHVWCAECVGLRVWRGECTSMHTSTHAPMFPANHVTTKRTADQCHNIDFRCTYSACNKRHGRTHRPERLPGKRLEHAHAVQPSIMASVTHASHAAQPPSVPEHRQCVHTHTSTHVPTFRLSISFSNFSVSAARSARRACAATSGDGCACSACISATTRLLACTGEQQRVRWCTANSANSKHVCDRGGRIGAG